MKRLVLLAAGLLMAFGCMAQELPNTVMKDMNSGKKLPFNEAITRGKVTLVSFWASSCIPCKKQIKNISSALPKWKNEADFHYMTVSLDETRAEGIARNYATSQGWRFPFYIDPNSDLKRSLGFQSVPFTVIINSNGKVVHSMTGYEDGSESELFDKIKALSKK